MSRTNCLYGHQKHSGLCCEHCPKGQYVKTECSDSSETKCEKCPHNTYTKTDNYMKNCLSCSQCEPSNQQVIKACSAESDTQCGCAKGFYCVEPSKASHCNHCHPLTRCLPGEGVTHFPTNISDTKCGACPEGTFSNVTDYSTRCYSHTRSNHKHRTDGHRPEARSSPSPSPSPGLDHATYKQNGHHSSRIRNGKESANNHLDDDKANDKLRSLALFTLSEGQRQTSPNGREVQSHGAPCRSPGGLPAHSQGREEKHQRGARLASETLGRRGDRQRAQEKCCRSPGHSSDSQQGLQTKAKTAHLKKTKSSSKRHHRGKGQNRHCSTSTSPSRHRHTSGRKKTKSSRDRSSSWSSARTSSRSNSREHLPSKTKSPHTRQNNSRERDSPHYSDGERPRRRSRSYSPIRKRRRDSPSFMEARRITSARKRPIPYYRPSPSSSSSDSSYSSSSRGRSRSRTYDSYSSYSRSRSRSRNKSRSRSRSRSRTRSRSPSQAHSYYSHSSYESPGF